MGKVLVTGATGFIGGHVSTELARVASPLAFDLVPASESGIPYIQGDIRDYELVRKALASCEALCHLAARADPGPVRADPRDAASVNIEGLVSVLEACRAEDVPRIVLASTVWVYNGFTTEEPVNEHMPLRVLETAHPYSASKVAQEAFAAAYARLYGLSLTVLRLGIPYGPRMRLHAAIPSFIRSLARGQPLRLEGSGEQHRPFLHVQDVARAFVAAASTPQRGLAVFNVTPAESHSLREVLRLLEEVTGKRALVEHVPPRLGDPVLPPRYSTSAIAQSLGWSPTIPLRSGLQMMVESLATMEYVNERITV